jgi:hypothetical protein
VLVVAEAVRKRAHEGLRTFALLIPNEPRKGRRRLDAWDRHPSCQPRGSGPGGDRRGDRPLEAVNSALRQQPGFDEVIISTLPRRVSEWIRRDLPHRVVTLGVPVTTISPHGKGETARGHRRPATWLTRLALHRRDGRASSIQRLGSAR